MRKLAAGFIGIAIILLPAAFAQDRQNDKNMDAGMQRAIQFQRNKDAADARQAETEKNRPTVSEPSANRSAEPEQGRIVTDSGPAPSRSNSSEPSADRTDMSAVGATRSAYRTEPTREELQRAVTWEHFKDAAAARQAATGGRGPSKEK